MKTKFLGLRAHNYLFRAAFGAFFWMASVGVANPAQAAEPVLCAPIVGSPLVLDGDLSDWGTPQAGDLVLQQEHHAESSGSWRVNDAALIRLRRDETALWIGVRVVDDSICNPFPLEKAYEGDCIEVFLDAREGGQLGQAKYGDSAYQFALVPPLESGVKARFGVLSKTVAPQGEKYRAGEMCDTINSHWGRAADDFSMKSPAQIIAQLAQCRRFGANLLLNIGPLASGRLPAYERAALEIVGRWLAKNGGREFLSAAPTDFRCASRDFVLRGDRSLFYVAFDLGIVGNAHLGGEIGALRTIAGELPEITRVVWQDSDEELRFSQDQSAPMFTFEATGNPYGTQAVARVARMEIAG